MPALEEFRQSLQGQRISIERIEDRRDRQAMEVANDAEGLATAVADGDVVRVYSIIPKYQQTVILRGNTANPGRFAWRAGMHISDLIPDKDSLITRNYWWRRARLGLPAPEEVDFPTPAIVQWNQSPTPSTNQRSYPNQSASGYPGQYSYPMQMQNPMVNQTQDQNQALMQALRQYQLQSQGEEQSTNSRSKRNPQRGTARNGVFARSGGERCGTGPRIASGTANDDTRTCSGD